MFFLFLRTSRTAGGESDGSDIQIATNPDDEASYFPGTNGRKTYNPLHLNALYDIRHRVYIDTKIQGRMDCNEYRALQECSDPKKFGGYFDNYQLQADRLPAALLTYL